MAFDPRPLLGTFTEFARSNGVTQVPVLRRDDDDTEIPGHVKQFYLDYKADGKVVESIAANLFVSSDGQIYGGQAESAVRTIRRSLGLPEQFEQWVSWPEFVGQVPPRLKPVVPTRAPSPIGSEIPGLDGCYRDMGSGHVPGERVSYNGALYEFYRASPFYAFWNKL